MLGSYMKQIDIIDIEFDNGAMRLTVCLDSEFKKWFLMSNQLKRWSPIRFQRTFIEALDKAGIVSGVDKVNVIFTNE